MKKPIAIALTTIFFTINMLFSCEDITFSQKEINNVQALNEMQLASLKFELFDRKNVSVLYTHMLYLLPEKVHGLTRTVNMGGNMPTLKLAPSPEQIERYLKCLFDTIH